ncbi:S8 family serine peptidase [Vibrio alginolyticus]|nr:S8 family serine peptidase [Vibrio alginolyticus]
MFSMPAIRSLKITILALLITVLAGCGGGGGGGGGSSSKADTTPPVITILGDNPTTLVVGDEYDDAGATAEDAVDGTVSVTSSGSVDTNTLGTYAITYEATDASGNTATATRTVTVLAFKEAKVSIEQGLSAISLEEGEQKLVAFVVKFTDGNAADYLIELEQFFDAAGISLSSNYPSTGWVATDDNSWIVNVTLTAETAGEYILTSRVTLTETGEIVEVTLPITITSPAGADMTLSTPGADKDAIALGSTEEVVFTSKVIGGSSAPETLSLEQVDSTGAVLADLGVLADDGVGEDLVAGDLVYTGTASLTSSAVGDLYFQTSSENVISDTAKISVTEFPTTIAASDTSALISDADGNQIFSNELLVKFTDGISAARIQEIIAAESGTIVGSVMSLGIYQVQMETSLSLSILDQAILDLEAYDEVEYAEYSAQTSVDAFPDDTDYSSQSNMTTIRADEAWYVSSGNTFISMIDTGVDYQHTELDGKVINGRDFVSADDDSMDEDGHGTHVAGIAVAKANNGDGIAGLAWNSKVIAVRGLGGSYAALVAAIRYSVDRGSKVINISGGAYVNSDSLNSAVAYAKSKSALVVSTAGNDGLNESRYPCAYDSVLCVANSTNADGKASSSNFGAWVDIAAPGEDVSSTQLGGGITTKSGTSMAASLISGAAAMVWTQHPEWAAENIRTRLIDSGKTLSSSLLIGSARLDVFEAVFNGSFEIGDLSEWQVSGTASSITELSSLLPVAGNRMAILSTGPSEDGVETTLTKSVTIQPGVTELPLEFTYNFITEEYPEYIGSQFDDTLVITLTSPDGTVQELVTESVNDSEFTLVEGLDLPDGDDTAGQTGFKTVNFVIPVTEGEGEYRINISDQEDGLYDSVLLIDNIRLK